MHFHAEHRLHGSPGAIAGLLADPSFYVTLALPDLGQPELLDRHVDGEEAVVRLRYEFIGTLDPIVRRLLGSTRLAWVQEIRVTPSAQSGTLEFGAEKDPKRLHGSANFTLVPDSGNTLRRLDGDLAVNVPLIGQTAERRIVPGLLRRLDIEAQALDDRLQRGG